MIVHFHTFKLILDVASSGIGSCKGVFKLEKPFTFRLSTEFCSILSWSSDCSPIGFPKDEQCISVVVYFYTLHVVCSSISVLASISWEHLYVLLGEIIHEETHQMRIWFKVIEFIEFAIRL